MGQGKTVVSALFLKRGILRDTGKEILKRLAQLHDGHLRRVLGDLQHPRKLVSLDGIELTPQGCLGRLRQRRVGLPRIILLLPLVQGPIVGKARDPCRLAEIRLLHIVGIERNFMGQNHEDASSTACFTPSNNFWFLRERLPYSRAENTVMISRTSWANSSSNVVSSP